MTEAEWRTCTHFDAMADAIDSRASNRKKRLLAVGCCRRLSWFKNEPEFHDALLAAEAYADGWEKRSIMVAFGQSLRRGNDPWIRNDHRSYSAQAIAAACSPGIMLDIKHVCSWIAAVKEDDPDARRAEWHFQCEVLRDIFGNPFRPVALDHAWLTSTAVAIAHGIYDVRAFDRMPILADSLQDAGCENADILAHCRGEGPHVRGCWVVDLVLGKE